MKNMKMLIPGRIRQIQYWINQAPTLFGWLLTPRRPMMGGSLQGLCYGIDNECYALGDRFDPDRYLRAIDRILARHGADHCIFATAPDIVGNARRTLDNAEVWLPKLRSLGIPAGLVAQDGLEDLDIPWPNLDALFVGGTTQWKTGPAVTRLIAEARRRGKWVHAGRVNGRTRISHFWHLAANSFDGTGIAIAPQKELSKLVPHLQALNYQPYLLEET